MNLGTNAIYDVQERRASSKPDAIRNNPHCHCAPQSNPSARRNPEPLERAIAVFAGLFIGVPIAVIVGGIWGYNRGISGK